MPDTPHRASVPGPPPRTPRHSAGRKQEGGERAAASLGEPVRRPHANRADPADRRRRRPRGARPPGPPGSGPRIAQERGPRPRGAGRGQPLLPRVSVRSHASHSGTHQRWASCGARAQHAASSEQQRRNRPATVLRCKLARDVPLRSLLPSPVGLPPGVVGPRRSRTVRSNARSLREWPSSRALTI